MNEPPASPDAPRRLRLLFVHSGSPKKRLTFDVAAALGSDIYLLNPEPNWAVPLAREFHATAGLSLPEVLDLAADIHARVGLDGVVTFWEEDVPTSALIARRLHLPGNLPTAALDGRSKYRMRRAFANAGVPVPLFAPITDRASLLAACEHVGLPAVLKPEWGADSEWVTRVTSVEEALEVFEACHHLARVQNSIYPYPAGRFLLEGYLIGPEVSVEGVVQDGRVTLYAIIDKARMAEPSFIERGERTPSRLRPAVQEAVRDMVVRGVAALGLTNSGIHAEVKITPQGPRLVEIGARMGGDCIHALVKRVYGIDLAEENLRAALGLPVHEAAPPLGCALSTTLVPERAGRVVLREEIKPRRTQNLIEVVLTKQPGDQVLLPPQGYDNLAWVSVWGKDYRAAQRSLHRRTNRVAQAIDVYPEVERHRAGMARLAAAGGS
ncbi:MAG: ATP-grasp domain-containing protein [Gemmatimonadota bacterium]